MRSMSVFVAPEDEASSFWKRGLKEIVVVVVVVVVVKKRIIIIIIIIINIIIIIIYNGIGYTLDQCIFARTTDEASRDDAPPPLSQKSSDIRYPPREKEE